MKYSKYFGLITRDKGGLNLSTAQFQRLMNIVFLEGSISGLNKAKQTYKDTNQFYRYDTIIFKENKRLTDLTGNLPPDKLLKEMHRVDKD
jgi:hypothetical protein